MYNDARHTKIDYAYTVFMAHVHVATRHLDLGDIKLEICEANLHSNYTVDGVTCIDSRALESTGPIIRFLPTCRNNVSYMYLVEDRTAFMQKKNCAINLILSYKFSTRLKSQLFI